MRPAAPRNHREASAPAVNTLQGQWSKSGRPAGQPNPADTTRYRSLRGPSYLVTGTAAAPDKLTFSPYARFDVKVFADLAQLFGTSPFTKGTRITL